MRKMLTISFLMLGLIGLGQWVSSSFASPRAQCGSPTTITVIGADGTRCESTQSSGLLAAVLAQVAPRAWVKFSDGARTEPLTIAPASLRNLLAAVPDRVQFAYSNGGRTESLVAPSAPLQTGLEAVADRIRYSSANGSRNELNLSFPRTIVNDVTKPSITLAEQAATHSRVVWTTNEFSECSCQYGLAQNNLNKVAETAGYFTSHTADIVGVSAEQSYFYRVTCTDLSGNVRSSGVVEVAAGSLDTLIFLPLIER